MYIWNMFSQRRWHTRYFSTSTAALSIRYMSAQFRQYHLKCRRTYTRQNVSIILDLVHFLYEQWLEVIGLPTFGPPPFAHRPSIDVKHSMRGWTFPLTSFFKPSQVCVSCWGDRTEEEDFVICPWCNLLSSACFSLKPFFILIIRLYIVLVMVFFAHKCLSWKSIHLL